MLVEYKNVIISHKDNPVLADVNFTVEESEFIYLIGKVGSGKSSLLKTMYGELSIVGGSGKVLDYEMSSIKRKFLPGLRKQLGIVFQDFQLLRDRSVYDNLYFVLRATGWKQKNEIDKRINEVLDIVKLTDKNDKYPHELSGGEQQRVAIARAILNKPRLILADEPTGNLDRETGRRIVSILKDICKSGTAIVMSTHNLDLLQAYPGIVYRCNEGKLQEVTAEYNAPLELDDNN